MFITDKEWLKLLNALQAAESRIRNLEDALPYLMQSGIPSQIVVMDRIRACDQYLLHNTADALINKQQFSLKDKECK